MRSLSAALLLPAAMTLNVALKQSAQAGPIPNAASVLCEQAIDTIEREGQLPPHLLGAIARIESGRPDLGGSVRPWPWTINADGRGYAFGSKAEAIDAIVRLRERGILSIDVGCMQINLMYHAKAFSTLDEALDPLANVKYSARFLLALRTETGAWRSAVAFYHSRTPALAAEYERKVAFGPKDSGET